MKHFKVAYVFIGSIILITSCTGETKDIRIKSSDYTLIDTLGGSCPHFTKDNDGNIVLSWIRNFNDSSHLFCYAVSKDGGNTFQHLITVPGSTNIHPHAENLPKIVFKRSGEIIAIWGAGNPNPINAYSGLVYYAQSFDMGKNWMPARKLVTDNAGFDQRYFDVALMPNGEAAIVWLDNRKTTTKEGAGLYFAITEGRNGFQHEKLIAQPCCECCRTELLIDKGNIHIVYRAILNDSIRDIVHAVSIDDGKTFSAPLKISEDDWIIRGCPHSGPAMTANGKGIQLAWFTGGDPSGVYYTQTIDNGKTFSQRDSIGRKARHPQITSLNNADLVTVWDESFQSSNKYFSRIGIEKRSNKGQRVYSGFIPTDTVMATYPVITTTSENVVLAYCIGKSNESRVAFQTISFRTE